MSEMESWHINLIFVTFLKGLGVRRGFIFELATKLLIKITYVFISNLQFKTQAIKLGDPGAAPTFIMCKADLPYTQNEHELHKLTKCISTV